jgi:6-phosphogluconolactonase/glucosamine-6-phosphate isomerase/deaminase
VVDERFGEKLHERSNEMMMKESGLLRYLELQNIPFYPILQSKGREETADLYDEKVRELHAIFQRSVALLGIGSDGHTAGIAGNRKDFKNPLFDKERQHLLVSEFHDEAGMFQERVTMTFLGLSMTDLLVVLVFGDDKKEALNWMFADGSEEEIPARFYKRPDIAQKTIIITDQAI